MIEKLPVNITDIRYISAILIILIASIKKQRSTKNTCILALIICWVAYGLKNTIYLLISIILNLIIMWSFKPNEYIITITNIANLYCYKLFGRFFEPRIDGTFDISGALMLLTIKMGYVTKYFDKNLENFLEYIFFIPGLITGPAIPYDEFNKKDKKKPVPFPYKEALIALLFLVAHAILRLFHFKSYVLSNENSFLIRLISLYFFNVLGRTRFHFAWNFAHCCFIMYDLPEYLNIDFYKVEFTESVKEISLNWNKCVSLWLRTLFFNPLKAQSIAKAVIVSHLISAALHGINPCYAIFTLSFGMYSKPVTFINNFIKYKILRQIQMVLFVTYFSIPFYLLNLSELYLVWKQVYFCGHIYFTVVFLYYWYNKLFASKVKKD